MKNFNRKNLLLGLLIILSFVFMQGASIPFTYLKRASMVDKVMKIIEENFVPLTDTQEINEQVLIYGAIEGMLAKLEDPYSRFMPPESFKEMQEETSGTFGGVGIIITNKDEYLMVVSPLEGTPAWRAGIQPGDIIFEIDGKSSAKMNTLDATKIIKGPVGTEVNLKILRKTGDGSDKYYDFVLKRDNIKVSTISQSGVIEEHIGYIRISNFGERTGEEFKEELEKLKKNAKIDSLILDLRSNPGGLLNTAVEVSRALLPAGKTVVSIRGRNDEEVNYPVYHTGVTDLPLIVLINKGSASGSEIVAGAIKDNKRGLIVGSESFGKGLVQTVIPLDDGSAMAITTAKYYTPSGISIHGTGITPDISVEMPEATDEILEELNKEREANYDKEQERIFEREQGKVINVEVGKFDRQLREAVVIIRGAKMLTGISGENVFKK
ncbi:MAG: S41 family peptidase [Candidatus Muiribacteriota bacterium]